jgi:hypothetical protein
MNIEWVSDIVVRGARMKKSEVTAIVEQLYANPYKWAKFGENVPNHSWKKVIEDQFDGIEVVLTGGNNLASDNPNKRFWTMYLRYNPETRKNKGENIETK